MFEASATATGPDLGLRLMKSRPFEITVEQFRHEVERVGDALAARGFRRDTSKDSHSPTTSTVAYVGRHVAFEFILDRRDHAIDLMVMRCEDGRLIDSQAGGYRSSLFSYLLHHCGFRGRSVLPAPATPAQSELQLRLLAVMNLLEQPCAARLLEDRPDSLP